MTKNENMLTCVAGTGGPNNAPPLPSPVRVKENGICTGYRTIHTYKSDVYLLLAFLGNIMHRVKMALPET